MSESRPTQSSLVSRFRELHAAGCFVLPNPWDVGTAVYLQHLGFKALATTSAGFAFSRGLPDSVSAISRDTALAHFLDLVNATDLPINADYQNGYAEDPEGVAANVKLCIATGVAGLSIEDSTGDPSKPLYERSLSVERVKAARDAIDASGTPVVLTARCEAWLLEQPNATQITRETLAAYVEAGADCLYAPGIRDLDEIATLVRVVAPKPLNVLVSAPGSGLTVARLAEVGVRRISVGSALARVSWRAFASAARSILDSGTFESLGGAAPFVDLNGIFGRR
jgi:2-methylisocitrate lyase-like PEP mutase family enzyme